MTDLAESVRADSADTPESLMAKPRRSLKKYGVMSLAQSISMRNDGSRLRWNMGLLEKNPDALEASRGLAKPKRKS